MTKNPIYAIIFVRTVQASLLAMVLHWLLRWPLTGPRALGLCFTPLLCLYFVFVFVAPWTWGLPIRTRLATREQVVALTFDDGPSAETTPRLLDTLASHGVRATFFVLGEAVERQPELLRRIVAQGHHVGIHGYRHVPFVLLSQRRVEEEIERTRDAIRRACPEASNVVWLRPPHGFKTLALPGLARRAGYRLVAWSVNAGDYRMRDPGMMAARLLARARPGAILLLHDGEGNRATADALPAVLEGLRGRGYGFAVLD